MTSCSYVAFAMSEESLSTFRTAVLYYMEDTIRCVQTDGPSYSDTPTGSIVVEILR